MNENDDAAWSNSRLIRAFNRTVIPASLGDELPKNARSPVTFHSFRGCFKAMLYSVDYRLPTNLVHEVVGHAKSELDARYIGTIPIEETYPACSELSLPRFETSDVSVSIGSVTKN